MSSPSRNNPFVRLHDGALCRLLSALKSLRKPAGNRGAAMPLVLIFAVIVAITTTIYVSGQTRIARMEMAAPARLQALLTARSGVWWAMDRLRDTTGADTLKTIDTRSTDFTRGLFDTSATHDSLKLTDDGTSVDVSPFSSDGFGTAQIRLTHDGAFRIIQSRGMYRAKIRNVEARIGGSVLHGIDTLLYVKVQVPALVAPCIGGTKAGSFTPAREVHDSLLNKVIASYTQEIAADTTLGLADAPLTIQKDADISKIQETVNGPLFIDGSFWEIRWKEKRTVRVMGDLQFTGSCKIEGISFIVLGEVRIGDKANLKNVSIFSGARLFIGDEAVLAGHLLSLGSVTIYGRAHVQDRSTIVSAGRTMTTSGKSTKTEKTSGESLKNKNAIVLGTNRYGVIIDDAATVDGCVFALRSPGSIKTTRNVLVTGMLFATNELSHAGKLRGIAKATRVIDASDTSHITENNMPGCIEPLDDIDAYIVPGFIGDIAIVSWKEE